MPPVPNDAVRSRLVQIARIVALAALYIVAALGGLRLDAVATFATLVWAPSGISLAAILLFGVEVWPGIAIGAITVTLIGGAPPLAALAIGVGNTLEALAGAYLLRRLLGRRIRTDRVRDMLAFLILAVLVSTLVSATIGVSSLTVAGVIPPDRVVTAWRAWWLGDAIGDLLVVPLALAWADRTPMDLDARRSLEAGVIVALLAVAAFLVFGAARAGERGPFAYAYMFFPPLVWVALRFEQRGVTLGLFLVAVLSMWSTVQGRGPFVQSTLTQSLFAMQTFLGLVGGAFLVLGAAIAERRQSMEALRRARDAASGANKAKSDFLAVVSHELRTPLNAIMGYVELMQMEIKGPLTDGQRDSLTRVRESSNHLRALIDDVLSFAKIEAGRVSVALENVLVSDSLTALESVVAPDIQKKQLALSRLVSDPALRATADPEKLRQILLNLVGNAVKFTPAGGRITVGADAVDGLVRIWVTDTGVGIPADKLDHVFEPFFQADRGTTRIHSGLGLGLAISRDLARAMHGDIQLESPDGQGTTATLTLPSG